VLLFHVQFVSHQTYPENHNHGLGKSFASFNSFDKELVNWLNTCFTIADNVVFAS
jgi:hypothetical protein